MNIATLDRWTVITMTYTDHEPELLARILPKDTVLKMMQVTQRIRTAINQGQLPDLVFSTRRLLHWAEAMKDSSLTFKQSVEMEVMGRFTGEEREIVGEFVKDAFGVSVK